MYGKYIIAKTLDLQRSENKIVCTPKPKWLRKSNKWKSYEYYQNIV